VFYLKYRPKTVSEIDNTKVREIISKILNSGNLSHAYLFVGQKGTGKTSAARIFSKAINCLDNKFTNRKNRSFEPCNRCHNCLSISHSTSVDILEMDAASNRGIDDVRKLIHESNFLPMTSRYRVFIIDEAHMITPEAFNALLKTLEEPPQSVIFIFATTNKEKLPKTIISRCQVVNFGRANQKDIIRMLNRCIEGEKIKIDEKLFPLIASHSDFSFRDAAKILEELVIQGKLTFTDGQKFLGFYRRDFLEILEKKDLKTTLSWIDEFSQTGGSIKVLIEQIIEELRAILFKKSGLIIDEATDTKLTKKEIITLIKILTQAYQNLRTSPIESLPLEIAIVEFYNETYSKVKS